MSSNRDFVIQFIAKFKDLSCLWDVTDTQYHNKQKRDAALIDLLRFYKTKITNANIDTVKKKIQSLRASFRKEFNKVSTSITINYNLSVYYLILCVVSSVLNDLFLLWRSLGERPMISSRRRQAEM